ITFTVLSDKSIFEPAFSVSATASSGLPVTFSTTTSSVCTVTAVGTVTLVTTGMCTIEAAQTGGLSGAITYAVAPAVTQSFMIRTIQTITFAQPADRLSSAAAFSIGATASSGLPVTYVSSTPSVCTVTTTGTVTLVTYGACTIVASQIGGIKDGTTFAAAFDVSRTFNSLRAQTVSFSLPTDKIYTAADFTVIGSSTSTLPVSYTSGTPAVCTISPTGTINLVSPGTCSINATQEGGTAGGIAYGVAPVVTKTFTVNPVPQTASVAAIPESHEYQGGVDLAGSTSSGLEITYTSLTPTVCTVIGKKVTFLGIGKCSIKASQAGGTKSGVIYGPSPDVIREFFVTNYTATATVTPTNTRTFTPTLTPTPIPFLLKKGAVGASFVLGLLQNDTLVTWGMNREYQANIPPCCGSGIQDIAVGTNFALALKGGKVFGWGANTKGQLKFPASTNKDITAIAAGGAHGLALTKGSTVIAWGDNGFKQAAVPKGLKSVSTIAGGANHSVVLLKDGSVVAWGSNSSNQAKPPLGLKGIRQVAAGLDHTLALKTDGTVIAWGNNSFGQAAIPSNAIDIKQVSAGTQFSMAVKNDGTVLAWGRNDYQQIIIPTEYKDIYSAFAGYSNTILGLRSGRIVVLGSQTDGVDVSRTPTKTATPTP
ncbi:MAG: Cellulosome-anchoring protein precursor, partial [Chloroflexota bacterium]